MEAEGLLAQLSSRETYSENEGSSLKNLFTYWFKEELFAKKIEILNTRVEKDNF